MGYEYEESQKCLSGLAERSYVFILYMNYTIYVYYFIVYAFH
jgi:hypothetical protein